MAWPTTNNPRTEFVTLRMTADEAADLDWLMQRTNFKSRSGALRSCVERVVAAERKRAAREKAGHDVPGTGADG